MPRKYQADWRRINLNASEKYRESEVNANQVSTFIFRFPQIAK